MDEITRGKALRKILRMRDYLYSGETKLNGHDKCESGRKMHMKHNCEMRIEANNLRRLVQMSSFAGKA